MVIKSSSSMGWSVNQLINIPNGQCPDGGAHYWIIDSPDGQPTSMGTCRNYGQRKEFRNWFGLDLATRRNCPSVKCRSYKPMSAPTKNVQGGFVDDQF